LLLLHLLLLLYKLLLSLCVLLLDCDVVLGRGTLLFSLAKDERRVDCAGSVDVLTTVNVSEHTILSGVLLASHVVC